MFKDVDLKDKRVLVRCDLDVPVKAGRVENNFRLRALLPTLKLCLANARQTCLIGHLGRPEGEDLSVSLVPVQEELKRLLNQDIRFLPSGYSPGDWWRGESPLTLLENLRFDPREDSLDREFAADLAVGADLYIYEAFATYRPCTSLQIIPELIPTNTGLQFDNEISVLSRILYHPASPTLLLASGAKLDKLEIIKAMMPKFDKVLLGGKFAHPDHLASDGLDLNQQSIQVLLEAISEAKTIILNGPLGLYEDGLHDKATRTIFQALKEAQAFIAVGGGDTLAAISSLGFAYEDFDFVSTGGGAMLDFLATGTHPLLQILEKLHT